MANGHPKYGGGNGVSLLDVGQIGGVRNGAGDATFTVKVERGPMVARANQHPMAQLAGSFEEHLGLDGETFVWRGTIVAKDEATLNAITDDLDSKLAGHKRDTLGKLTPFDQTEIWATQLTDAAGKVLSTKARITGWQPRGPRLTGNGKAILQVEVTFKALQ